MTQDLRTLVQEPKKKWKYRSFLSELKVELKKVSWTSKEDLVVYTKIVVVATFLFGLGIYLTDLVVRGSLNWMGWAVHRIFG